MMQQPFVTASCTDVHERYGGNNLLHVYSPSRRFSVRIPLNYVATAEPHDYVRMTPTTPVRAYVEEGYTHAGEVQFCITDARSLLLRTPHDEDFYVNVEIPGSEMMTNHFF